MIPDMELFDSLEQLSCPTDLTANIDSSLLAFVGPSSDPRRHAVPIVVDAVSGDRQEYGTAGFRYGLTRFGDGRADLAAARGLPDGELETVLEFNLDTPAAPCEVSVSGAVEDICHIGERRWLLRLADAGSYRDGMHLGTRVFGFGDPYVDPVARRWRRLAIVDFATRRTDIVPTDGWTIWDATQRGDVVLAVASTEPSPSGYYSPCLLRIDVLQGSIDVLSNSPRQLARPRLSLDGRYGCVVEGRSIVSGQVRKFDLETGQSEILDDLHDVTDLGYVDETTMWFSGWADRHAFIETRHANRPETICRRELAGTIHGRDGQPSAVPLSPDGRFAVVFEDAESPPEVYVSEPGHIRPVTDLNSAARHKIANDIETVEMSWTSTDGIEIHGGLLSPTSDARRPLPLVVIVHGGPTWLWSTAYAPAESNNLARSIASAGASVLLANPRGSSGRTLPFSDAIVGEVGVADVDDLLGGVDRLVADGVADPDRVAVVGTSYGGYMAAWLAATTDRFACAVAFSCVSDWCSFSMSSSIGPGFVATYFGDVDPTSREGREALAERSPVHRVQRGAPPILVLHGADDHVTPIGQASELVNSWRSVGAEAELAVYQREGHEFVEPGHRRDAARRVLRFLNEHGILDQ